MLFIAGHFLTEKCGGREGWKENLTANPEPRMPLAPRAARLPRPCENVVFQVQEDTRKKRDGGVMGVRYGVEGVIGGKAGLIANRQ